MSTVTRTFNTGAIAEYVVAQGWRKPWAKDLSNAMKMLEWLNAKLTRSFKNLYQEHLYGFRSPVIIMHKDTLMRELGLTYRMVDLARKLLAELGLVHFWKAIKREGKWLNLWVVTLESRGMFYSDSSPLPEVQEDRHDDAANRWDLSDLEALMTIDPFASAHDLELILASGGAEARGTAG